MSKRTLLPHIEVANEAGARLFVLERRDVPVVSGRLICRGAITDDPSHAAAADLASDLFNQGPRAMTPQQWRTALERDAIDITVWTIPTAWELSFSCLREDADVCIAHAQTLLSDPALPRAEWRSLVGRWRARTKENFAQPKWLSVLLGERQCLGGDHPYAQLATPRVIRHARFDDVAAIARRGFASASTVQAYVGGDVSSSEGLKLLRALCAAVDHRGDRQPAESRLAPSRHPVWILDSKKSTQAFFAVSGTSVRAPEEERVALRVANHVIGGGGFTSRLMDRVRSEMGQTYGISSRLPEEELALPFSIWSFTRAENLGRVLTLIHDVLEDLASSGVRPEELDVARDHLYGSLPLQMTDPSAILAYIAKWGALGVDVEALEADWRLLRDIDAARVNAALARLAGADAFRVAAVGPAAVLKTQLEPFGEARVFSQGSDPEAWHD